jgi:hypothetical protein
VGRNYDGLAFTVFALTVSMVDFSLQTARLPPATENLPMSCFNLY